MANQEIVNIYQHFSSFATFFNNQIVHSFTNVLDFCPINQFSDKKIRENSIFHDREIEGMFIHKGEVFTVTRSENNKFNLFCINSEKRKTFVEEFRHKPSCLDFHDFSDGRLYIVYCDDVYIKIFTVRNDDTIVVYKNIHDFDLSIEQIFISEDFRFMYYLNYCGTFSKFDLRGKGILIRISDVSQVYKTEEGFRIAFKNDRVIEWDEKTEIDQNYGKSHHEHTTSTFSQDGKTMASLHFSYTREIGDMSIRYQNGSRVEQEKIYTVTDTQFTTRMFSCTENKILLGENIYNL